MSDAELARLFLALVLLLSAALAGGQVFESLRLPRVIGEISGGFLLGPSVLGLLSPSAEIWLFSGSPSQPALLSAFYWLGLILLMFTAGFKVQPVVPGADRRLMAALVLGSMLLPFPFGWLSAPFFAHAAPGNQLAFAIVMGIGAAVTSIPVISRIFMDLGLMQTGFARVVVASASVQDLLLWIALAIATALQQGQQADTGALLQVAGVTVAFAMVSIALGPAMLRFAGRLAGGRFTDASLTGYTLLVCLVFVAMASAIQVNVIFGALLAGLIIGRFPQERFAAVKQRITDIALWFFVPIYFALVGQRLDLQQAFDGPLILGFLLATTVVKVGSVMVAVRLARRGWGEALDYGMAMNTRGGPGIVLASVALGAGIIDGRLFVAFILASILTALAAGLWFRWRLAGGHAY